MAFGHHRFARPQTLLDHDVVADALADGDGPLLDGHGRSRRIGARRCPLAPRLALRGGRLTLGCLTLRRTADPARVPPERHLQPPGLRRRPDPVHVRVHYVRRVHRRRPG